MTGLTHSTKPGREKNIKRGWHLVDAKDKILGRIAPHVAKLLMGKHKVNYVPYLDVGDYVVVVNAKKIVVTGKKTDQKLYTRYSGYPGGLRTMTFKTVLATNPSEIIRHAVSGMLPKNKQRDRRLTRLFVFPDEKHSYGDKLK